MLTFQRLQDNFLNLLETSPKKLSHTVKNLPQQLHGKNIHIILYRLFGI